MPDHTLPDADPADELEQQQPLDDPTEPVHERHEHSAADPVPEADAIEQSQQIPDPEGNDPANIEPD